MLAGLSPALFSASLGNVAAFLCVKHVNFKHHLLTVGDQFATFEAVVALAMLVRRFEFSLDPQAPPVGMTTVSFDVQIYPITKACCLLTSALCIEVLQLVHSYSGFAGSHLSGTVALLYEVPAVLPTQLCAQWSLSMAAVCPNGQLGARCSNDVQGIASGCSWC